MGVAVSEHPIGSRPSPVLSIEYVSVCDSPRIETPLASPSTVMLMLRLFEAGATTATPDRAPALGTSGSTGPIAQVPFADEFEKGPPLCCSKKPESTLRLLCRKKAWLVLTR